MNKKKFFEKIPCLLPFAEDYLSLALPYEDLTCISLDLSLENTCSACKKNLENASAEVFEFVDGELLSAGDGSDFSTEIKNNSMFIRWTAERAVASQLLKAAELALSVAEAWIHDQYDGTSLLKAALKRLAPVRSIIARAEGKVA